MLIRTRLTVALLSAVIIPLLIITVLVVMELRSSALNSFETRSSAEIRHIDTAFSLYLNGLAEDAAFLASTQALKALDESVSDYRGASKPTFAQRSGSVEADAYALMDDFGKARPDLAYVFLGLSSGGYIQWPGSDLGKYDPRQRPWYIAAQADPGKSVRAAAYEDVNTGAPLLDYLHTFTTDSGLQGVVGVDVTLSKLTDMVKQVQFGKAGYLILVEETGTVLADSGNKANNFKNIKELDEAYQQFFAREGLFETELNGQSWFATAYTSPALGWKFIGVIPADEVFAVATKVRNTILLISLVLLGIFAVLAYWISNLIAKPIGAVTRGLEEVASGEGDLTRRLRVLSSDESGQMANAFNRFITMIHSLVSDINEGAADVKNQALAAQAISDQLAGISDQQSNSIEQVSTAFNEMVATSNEVAKNCSETAIAADQSQHHVEDGRQFIQKTTSAVTALEKVIEDSNQAMSTLAVESRNITTILDTIRGIAEQTNLLALNAAIEAARAGEQGRGFAVVADEVRTLAGRTAESTEEIDQMITSLINRTSEVSGKLASSLDHSRETAETTEQTRAVFESIEESVARIRDMATQIAAAAEEQHLVAEEINQNIIRINTEATNANDSSRQLKENSDSLGNLSHDLSALVSRFRV
ncbi:methyl-accepting chemotaxis protein [Thalassolituus sp. UBA2009]|uniref:methyl-accepting chemotaxis protein n=1 Tax=Thalassolituus sp. UBA2009 TaxID=1947658 RepID=UPI00257E4AA6|nr:methyl-accepting chemotaxis protein [Thalassolituus sp. UBA2009]